MAVVRLISSLKRILLKETVDHIFSMPMPDSTYCHASPACCTSSSGFANLEALLEALRWR
jgi:hypothetical protein